MKKRFEKRDFWQYFKISLVSFQRAIRIVKRNLHHYVRENEVSIRCPSSAESRLDESRTARSNLRLPAFVLRPISSFSPLTERSSCQQRARGCTRGGYRARVSSPRARTRDARESRSTRWPRRDEPRAVPWVERVAFGWLANGSGKSRGRTPEGSRGVTLAPASMA